MCAGSHQSKHACLCVSMVHISRVPSLIAGLKNPSLEAKDPIHVLIVLFDKAADVACAVCPMSIDPLEIHLVFLDTSGRCIEFIFNAKIFLMCRNSVDHTGRDFKNESKFLHVVNVWVFEALCFCNSVCISCPSVFTFIMNMHQILLFHFKPL